MRKKGKKVIRPAGDELMDYLNRGFAICNRCGAVMDQREDPRGGCDIYACPSCGWEIDEMEYEYESGDPMELVQDERGDDYLVFRNDMPPAGCRACGGPYPYCKPSCRMFDDILKDEKAESVMKNHTMQCFDCLERLGYPIEKFLKEQEKES